MARKALKVKQARLEKAFFSYKAGGKRPKSITKFYNRCKLCGRQHGYMREFGICRCCFRHYARMGRIMGVKKASW